MPKKIQSTRGFIDWNPDLLIGGQYKKGSRKNRIDVIDPSNGLTLGTVANASVEDAISAIDAAHSAAASWAATPMRGRSEILRNCFELIIKNSDEIAKIISLENGKALKDARGEVAYAAEFFRWFSEEGPRVSGDLRPAPSGNNQILVQYQPIGVSVLITPWNFPAAMATRKIAPALAAGCTCVLKPATSTPLTAFAIASILETAGVPKGVVNVITTSSTSEVVDAMLHDPRVRKLSFTGSTEVGRVLLRKAADQVISSSMELGGNAPFIVFEDADIERAVEGAIIAKMRNGGEACTAANRFLVQRPVAEIFTKRLAEAMSKLKVGPGVNEDTDCGPLVDEATIEKVVALVKDAKARGARVCCGGQRMGKSSLYYPPTVLANVPLGAEIFKNEIFGPVAAIYTFDTEEEAIQLANNTEYGLIAYLYTRDVARGMRVAANLEAGMIALNRGIVSDPAAPFGGVKQSGLGREGAQHGILEFLEAKYIATTW